MTPGSLEDETKADEPTFDEHIKEWENKCRTHGKTSNEAGEYYDEHILPCVEETFIEKSKALLEQKEYGGLILTVGRSPEPQVLSLCAIAGKSTQVGLLYTNAAGDSFDRIAKRMDWTPHEANTRARIIDGSNTIEIYKTIMDFYTEWNKPKEIAVGITGGKKVMSSAAAMAGAILGADIYYVDTDTKNELNKPVPGSEYLHLLDNPYAVLGDLEVEKARGLYDRHDYAGAQHIFDQLEGEVGDPLLTTIYKAYGLLCKTYEAWDNLDIETAYESLNMLLSILERYSSVSGLVPLHDFNCVLVKQVGALKHLKCIFNNEELAFCIPDGFHFAFMLYHNALRQEAQGKLDTACLLLYRLLEWIGQHRLAQYGIITSQPDYSNSCMEEDLLLQSYKKKRKSISKKASVSALPNPITLIDGFFVLAALNDTIVKDLDWSRLMGQVNMRNKSIFAHGINKISPDSYKKFKSTVEGLFEKAQKIATIDADSFNEQHQFIAPLP